MFGVLSQRLPCVSVLNYELSPASTESMAQRRSAFGAGRRSAFTVRRSPFTVHRAHSFLAQYGGALVGLLGFGCACGSGATAKEEGVHDRTHACCSWGTPKPVINPNLGQGEGLSADALTARPTPCER